VSYHAFGKVLGNALNIMGEEGILFLKCPSNNKGKKMLHNMPSMYTKENWGRSL
jgi:hypothetical protein